MWKRHTFSQSGEKTQNKITLHKICMCICAHKEKNEHKEYYVVAFQLSHLFFLKIFIIKHLFFKYKNWFLKGIKNITINKQSSLQIIKVFRKNHIPLPLDFSHHLKSLTYNKILNINEMSERIYFLLKQYILQK